MAALTDEAAADKKARKEQNAASKKRQIELAEAVRSLYTLPAGRTYLIWLLEVGRALGQNSFRGDPHATAFACGENNVGLRIMAQMIEVDPASFSSLLKELHDARSAAADARSRANPDADSESDSGPVAESIPDTYT